MTDSDLLTAALITPLYASLFGLLFVLLSVRTLLLRRRLKIAIGHGQQPSLARAARAHANFAEYVPLTLLVGRLAHAYGVSQLDEDYRFRVFGMAMTFTALISASLRVLVSYFT